MRQIENFTFTSSSHIMSSKKAGAKSKGKKSQPTIRDDSGIQGATDARIEGQQQQDDLVEQHFLGFGTMNFDEGRADFRKLEERVEFATHNTRPLLQKHVTTLAHEIRTNFIPGQRIALNWPIVLAWLHPASLQEIQAAQMVDWGKADILTQLPCAQFNWSAIKKHGLKPLSGHVCIGKFRTCNILILIDILRAAQISRVARRNQGAAAARGKESSISRSPPAQYRCFKGERRYRRRHAPYEQGAGGLDGSSSAQLGAGAAQEDGGGGGGVQLVEQADALARQIL